MTIGQKITALKVQKRNPNRVNVYLDGNFAFGLARIVAAWLQVGEILTHEKTTKLQHQDTQEVAYQKALRCLSSRSRSTIEIKRKLEIYGYDQTIIEIVIERLKNNKLIGDEQFARNWVENRNTFRPRSHKLLALELRQKGVDEEVIQDVIQDAGSEEQLAYHLAKRQAPRFENLQKREFKQRLYAFLGRRGFNYEIINPVVQNIWDEMHQDITEINNFEGEELENE